VGFHARPLHSDSGQVLFDRRFLEISAKRLDIGRHVQRLDVGELADAVVLAPGEEFSHGMQVGCAGVPIADGGGEEFQEAARGVVAGTTIEAATVAEIRGALAGATTVSWRGWSAFITLSVRSPARPCQHVPQGGQRGEPVRRPRPARWR
jgi:hypothetical protein